MSNLCTRIISHHVLHVHACNVRNRVATIWQQNQPFGLLGTTICNDALHKWQVQNPIFLPFLYIFYSPTNILGWEALCVSPARSTRACVRVSVRACVRASDLCSLCKANAFKVFHSLINARVGASVSADTFLFVLFTKLFNAY